MKTKLTNQNSILPVIFLLFSILLSSCDGFFGQEKLEDKFEVSISETTDEPGAEIEYNMEGTTFSMMYAPQANTKKGSASNDEIWMGKTEVPYKLYKEIYTWATENGYDIKSESMPGSDNSFDDMHPAANVCWYDAVVWCTALTEYYNLYNGDKPDYTFVYTSDGELIKDSDIKNAAFDNIQFDKDANGFRFPTNAEWEAAASYKNLPDDYAAGASANYKNESVTGTVAWYKVNSDAQSHPVGTRLANALGMYDLSGNISEIAYDLCDRYEDKYAIRGGAYNSNPLELSIAESHPINRHTKSSSVGFRLARNLADEAHDEIETIDDEENNTTIEEGGTGNFTLNGSEYPISKAVLFNFNSIEAGYIQLVLLSENINLNSENSGGYEGSGSYIDMLIITDETALQAKTYSEESYSMIDFGAQVNCNMDNFPWTSEISYIGYNQELIEVTKDGDNYTISFSCNGSTDGGDTQTVLSGTYSGTLLTLDAGFDF